MTIKIDELKDLQDLKKFYLNLDNLPSSSEAFRELNQKDFYKKYVKSIKVIPDFRFFGFAQYYAYLDPIDLKGLDFRLLLGNSFQSVKQCRLSENSSPLLIKYIFPHQNPNWAYINWLANSKRGIQEYYTFHVNRSRTFLNLKSDFGASSEGETPQKFRKRMDDILTGIEHPTEESHSKSVKFDEKADFPFGKTREKPRDTSNSQYYRSLLKIYNYKSIDLKSLFSKANFELTFPLVHALLLGSEGLIFPYLSLKNLGLQRKIYIILPNDALQNLSIITKIFSCLTYGFIFQIEGVYYNQTLPEKTTFDNGLLIKTYLPQDELREFLEVFNFLFDYLHIANYKIITEVVDRKDLLLRAFKDLDFLEQYNPLLNFKWNYFDHKWENPKLFHEKLEP